MGIINVVNTVSGSVLWVCIAEIKKVRVALFQFAFTTNDQMLLPEPVGAVATLAEKVFVPAKDYPEVGTLFHSSAQCSHFVVQLCRPHSRSTGHDGQTVGARDRL
jgi:hypothetical protein